MPRLVNTASGTTAQTVNDAWPTTPESAVLYGKSVQNGTPTPENPIPVQVVGGRNLVNTAWKTWTDNQFVNNGITYTRNADGTITANGTATANSFCFLDNADIHTMVSKIIGKTVHLSGCPAGGSGQTWGIVVPNWGGTQVQGDYGSGLTITPTSYDNAQFYLRIANGNTVENLTFRPMLEAGAQATPYTPYGCIGLQIGESITPIDLQGHTLAGGDILRVNAAGRVWIDSDALEITLDGSQNWSAYSPFDAAGQYGYFFRTPETLYYNTAETTIICDAMQGISRNMLNPSLGITDACAVTTNGIEISARLPFADVAAVNAYFTANPAKVYARRATPQTIELGTIELPELTNPCELAIYASLDPEWAITYEQDPNAVINSLQASIAPVEGGTASTNYAVNSYLIHGNQLYRVTSAIATGEAITPGTNCVACTVMGEVIRLTA